MPERNWKMGQEFWRKIKKNVKMFGCLMICFFCSAPCGAEEKGNSYIPEELKNLYARSAVLMDGDSGRVLFGKNEEEVLPMASTTKIMTCILALELAEPEEICQVSEYAASQPKVHLGMRTGETYYLGDLLYSMMLESHNDTAVCVAEHVGGSVEEFAELMNQKAKDIGCRQTYFVTPNGLDGENTGGSHGTTAKDLGLIMRYCIMESEKREEFLEITRTAQYSFRDTSGKRSFSCTNHNALLTMMDGALSGKTGFTNQAGYCYVGAVRRDGKTLIVALLACGWPNNRNYKWADSRKLMEYGFSNYEKKSLDLSEISLPEIEIRHGTAGQVEIQPEKNEQRRKKFSALAASDEKLSAQIKIVSELEAPVEMGQRAGTLQIMLGESVLEEYPLICKSSVRKITYWFCLCQVVEEYLF